MTNIRELPKARALPEDLPALLRKMAERVESGDITEMVVVCVDNDDYAFLWPSGIRDSLILTTLAHHEAINRMKR